MNYRHAFHVGNHADVLKHWVLTLCLDRLTQKPAPIAVLDTHAGRGLYDLSGEAATRSPEWRDGVARVLAWSDAPEPLRTYLRAIESVGQDCYPGSPLIALTRLRDTDRLIACELHPEEHQALRAALAQDARAQVHRRDGYEAARALTPFPERRGLVLIDPPYEREDEATRATAAVKTVLDRFAQAVIVLWRPLKPGGAAARVDAELAALGRPVLRIDLKVAKPAPGERLRASGILLVNPPFGVARWVAETGPALASRLAQGPGAGLDLSRFGPNSD